MNKFNIYQSKYSEDSSSIKLDIVRKPVLYSYVISISFISFFSFGSTFNPGTFFLSLFSKSKDKVVLTENRIDPLELEDIIINTYFKEPFSNQFYTLENDLLPNSLTNNMLMPPPDPGGVAGAAIWFKADSGTSTTTEGAAITSWTDGSGNAHNLSQVTGTKQPLYRNNTTDNINFNPVVDFDGVDDELINSLGFLGSSIYTNAAVFAVSRTDEVKDHTLIEETVFGGTHFLLHNPWVDNNIHWDGANSNRISAVWSYTLGAPYLWTGHNNNALTNTSELRINGLTINSSTSSLNTFQGNNDTLNLGSEGGLKYYNGKIGEVMIYLSGLTAAERNQVESYLAIKYGFTLDQTSIQNYTASNGTTTYWNGTSNATYNNNIAGIARDDNSELLQKQSKSVNSGLQIVIGNGNTIAADNPSNSSTFLLDNSALIWGDDNGSVASWTSTGAPTSRQILDRTWKVQETGLVSSVKVQIADNSSTNGLPAEVGTVYLLVSSLSNFSIGAVEYPMTLNGANWEVDLNLLSGFFYTFATQTAPGLEICNNFSDDNGDGRTDEVYPGGIQSNMQLWLKAETGTNTTTEGQNVIAWADQSTNFYSADADTNATDYPTYTSNAINFNPGINFDGDYTDDYSDGLHLGSDHIYSSNEGLHVFMVADPNIDAETDNHCFDFGLAANGGYGMIYSNNDYGMYTNNSVGGTNTELIHSEGDEPALIEFEVDFNDFQSFFRNGTELSAIPVTIDYLDATRVNEADTFGLGTSNGPVSIGRKSASIYLSNNGGRIFDGNISEVIVYNDLLSDPDKQKINSYLAIKYGITLNHNYVSSSGAVKKDISDGYANAIAGIGLDDCSGLNQKQSKSAEPEAIVSIGLDSIASTNQNNASNFSGDGTYLVWGNDGTALNSSWNNSNISVSGGDYSRIDRVWSFSENFDVTDIALRLDVDNPSFDLPAMPGAANGNYYLFIDDDADFTNGGTTAYLMSLVSGSEWEVLVSDPTNSYFSFGINNTTIEICNNGSDDDGDGLTDCEDSDCGISVIDYESGQAAFEVIGQSSFSSSVPSTTDSTFDEPSGIAIDTISGKVFVAEYGNHRILRYASQSAFLNGEAAEAVIGQTDFVSNSSGTTQDKLNGPIGILVDQNGSLWVAEYFNHRVLRFDNAATLSNGANADGVLGQALFTTNSIGTTASTMNQPYGLFMESDGTLWVADASNERALRFDNAASKANGADADGVLGQPSFTSSVSGGTISTSSSAPGIVVIGGSLYLGSSGDNRILIWQDAKNKANGTDADRVLGQSDFTTTTFSLSASSIDFPFYLSTDKEGNLYVSDTGSKRVLVFLDAESKVNGADADYVLGQSNFTSSGAGVSDTRIGSPSQLVVFTEDNQTYLALTGYGNNRILIWTQYLETDELTSFSDTLNGSDLSGNNSLTFALVSQPAIGYVILNDTASGAFTYNPPGACPLNIDSLLSFQYSVVNGNGCIDTSEVSILLTDVNPCEICNNGIDDDGDGDIDCADGDCPGFDSDGDEICDYADLDNDNDGIPDIVEGCGVTTDISGTIGFGNNLINTTYALSGTSVTYTRSGANEATLTGYDAGAQGASIRIQSLLTASGTLMTAFSNPVGSTNFKLTDFDNLEDLTVNVYDENNTLYDLTTEGLISVGYLINQTGNQFVGLTSTYVGGPYTDGDSPDDDHKSAIQFYFAGQVSRIDIIYNFVENSSIRFTQPTFCSTDTDGDDVFNNLDLDSDNDGIFDLNEAGHSLADANTDGIIDGATSTFGTNGLSDNLEILADNGILNYSISDSETTPDGTYDAYELDSDDDTCNDALEEGIADLEGDGIAGTTGDPVNMNGLITTITYTAPVNNDFQNPLIGPCLPEICNDGIDNDADDDTDCDDTDCAPIVTLVLVDSVDCSTSTSLALSGAAPSGGIYSGTGVTGTNFDASAAGVGTHIITYTYTDANGCSNIATDDIVVTSLPSVDLTLPDTEECVTSTILALSGGSPLGGTYTGTGVSGTNFDAFTAGVGTHTITYTYTDGDGCSNTATDDIVVSSLPTVSLTLTDTEECVSSTTLALGGGLPSGGAYTGMGVSGTNFDASTAGAGTHTITYTFTDGSGCTNTATDDIVVYSLPSVSLNLTNSEVCETSTTLTLDGGSPAGGTFSGTGVSGTNFDASIAGVGTHTITYSFTDANSCTNSSTYDITVNALPIVSLTLPTTSVNVTSTTLALSGGTPLGGTYSGAGVTGTNFDASSVGSGNYTITYTYTDANGCENTAAENITVNSSVSFSALTDLCISAGIQSNLSGGSPSPSSTGAVRWDLNGVTFADGGVASGYFIYNESNLAVIDWSISVSGGNTASFPVMTYTPANSTITSSGTSNQFLINDNSTLRQFRYSTAAGLTDAGGSEALDYVAEPNRNTECFNCSPFRLFNAGTLDGTPILTTGVYSGAGVSDNGDGTYDFDPSIAGVGTHTLTYTYTNEIGVVNNATDDVIIYNLSSVSFDLLDTLECETSTTLELRDGVPGGGTFSGTGVSGNNFDASIAGVGTHAITYTFTDGNGCNGTGVDSITVLPLPSVSFTLTDDEECINNSTLILGGGSPVGGIYSGPGVSGGNFNASVAGLGTHTITYTYTDGEGCANTATDDITVIALPSVSLSLTKDSDCVSSSSLVLAGGSPAGGTYSGAGVTLTNFDASIAGAGVHTITYTYTDANGCENSATDNIVVFALPTVSLSLPDTEDCVLNNTLALSGGLPIGGTYSGLGVSGTNFNAATAGLGTHVITYTYTDGNACTNTATQNIEVVAAPTVNLTLDLNEDCVLNNTLALSGGTPLGGTYSGTGVSGTNFNAAGAGVGSHNIFYTYTDINGCAITDIDVITVYGAPSVSTVAPTNPLSCGGSDGIIQIIGAGGTGNYEYRLDSGTWQSSNIFSGLSAGSYNVYIRNDNDFCEVAYTSNPVILTDPSNPTSNINIPSDGCVNVSNSFNATNAGVGATYSWDFGSGASPATATGIGPHIVTYSSAGSKDITLSVSLAGCIGGDSESFTVNELPNVSLTFSDFTECVSDGVFVLNEGTPSGGTYSGTGVSGTNFNAATAGVGTHTITYTYTDANGCVNTATDDIEVQALPNVSLTLGTDEACVSSTSLTLTGANISGGTYTGTGVSGTNFDPSVAGVGTHTITYTYSDANGCTNTANDNITVFDFPTINLINTNNPTTCGGTEGVITISASGATGAFEYRLDSGTWQTSNVFNGLSAGSYNVSVRNDNGFCELTYASNPVVLTDPPATIVTTNVISDYTGEHISCVGEADGFATASGSGGVGPYTFAWSNGQTGDTLKNVVAGIYSVTATDAIGCQGTQTVTLNDPPPLGVNATFTDVSCYGGFDGAIDVTAIGGVGAYTYSWNDLEPEAFWAFDGSMNDISGNDHNPTYGVGFEIYSTDAVDGGQSFYFDGGTALWYDDDVSFLESPFTERTVVMWIKPDDLNGRQMLWDEGGRTHGVGLRLNGDKLQGAVRKNGGAASAYEMTFPNDGAWHQVGFVYDDGDFTLMIDGVFGTTFNTGFGTIPMLGSGLNQCGVGAKLGEDSFGGSIFGSPNWYQGLIDNISHHDIALRNQQVTDNFTDDGDRTGLPAGDYVVYVYDLNGCVDSITLTLNQPDSLALTANISDVLCNGGSTGEIDLVIAGGVGPFSQSWSTGASTENISSLVEGTYTVTVTDANNCVVIDSFIVNEPPELTGSATVTSNYNTYNVTCFGATDGNAIATPVGGVAPYTYSWSNGQTNVSLVNVGAGTYTVTITDDNNCTVTASVSLSNPPQITVSAAVSSSFGGEHISCVGASDGAATATASNGVGTSYIYTWSNGQTGATLNNVIAGTYTVTATDANGCSGTANVTLQDPPAINLTTTVTSNYNGSHISCAGASDGSADVSVSGGIGAFSYIWSNGQTGLNLVNVGAGIYTVTATDAFGCTETQTISLTNPSNVSVDINITSDFNGESISCNDGADGEATASGSGGVGPYTYAWSNGQTGATLTNASEGTYTVTVEDANGCTSTETVDFYEPTALTFIVNSADPSDCGQNDGIILFSASGGIGTYEYSIDGSNWQSSTSFLGLAPGTYFTYVRSTLGTCQVGPTAVTINIPEAPTIDNVTIINPTTGSSNDGGILVAASGNGSGIAIEYSINGSTWQSSNLFSGLTVGSYTLLVRFVGFVCESASPFTLTAGGGVVGQGGGENYCSDDLSGVQFVETYYIPFPEDQIFTSLSVLHSDTCGSPELVEEPIQTYVSLGAVEAGTVIYYDHWEDGYEPNLSFPVQTTTEIWGDGNPSNGIPPGYTVDYLAAADIIVLNNSVVSTTRQAVIDFDAGDKIGSQGNLSMTRLAWASGIQTLLAGALEVYPTLDWGTEFQIPVGENADVNSMFEYTAVTVMAAQNNTSIDIDIDGDGSDDVSITRDQGESYLVDGGVFAGATIISSGPIQVDLITGDICARAESRFFTLKPTEQWSDSYYNPVATLNDGSAGALPTNNPTYVHLYNPNNAIIQVSWETESGYQGQVAVAGNSTNFIEVPDSTGSRFYTVSGMEFYAIATIDSDADTDNINRNSAHDWGFALVPESQVSNQITLVGFAPGQDPTACTSTVIDKAAWTLEYVDSEETISESAPATNAFDGDTDTYWHTEYNGTPDDPQPHEIRIDLGANHDISGFRYQPNIGSKLTNTFSNNTYVAIDGASVNTITSQINIPIGGFISDVNILNLDVTHTFVNDLVIRLTSPAGTEVTLLSNICGDNDDIDIDIDDDGATYGSWPCPPVDGNDYQPFGSLSDFEGEDVSGVWTLEIEDVFAVDGGGLNGWQLQVTTGTVGNGTIADYEFYVSLDGSNWNAAVVSGTWANDVSKKEESFPTTYARYIRLVSTSEVNGNPWTSIAELDVLECAPISGENSAPVWLTAAYPSSSSSTGPITVCVDYNGDGGSLSDSNGEAYDASIVLNNLQNSKIYDPDGNQTGMQIWVCDGSDAVIAGAWGQDPATASGGIPAIDLGVGLPNGIPFATSKCADLSKDYNSNGLYDECDEVIYTLFIRNSGALPLSTGSINVKDTLPSDIIYIENSTVAIVNGAVNNVPDNNTPNSPFPIDEDGINYSAVIQPGDSVIFRFEAVIGDISGAKFITNIAHVSNAQKDLYPEVSFPAQEPTGAIPTGIPIDTTLMCGTVPAEPVIGSDIYITNNCEELDIIPQTSWTLHYVDSQQGSEPATNAFDGDINTFWQTEYSPSSPGHSHEIQIDLGATYNIAGFRYLPRQSGNDGKIADFEFYVSEDGVDWGTAVTDGTWTNNTTEEEEVFSITRARFIRLVADSEINGNPWTSLAELNVLQCVNFAPVTIDFTEVSTQTNDGSTTDDCYEITRNWETTDHCGEVRNFTQLITVIDTIAPVIVGVPSDITVASNAIPTAPILNCVALGNIALGKPTNQSSTSGGNVAGNAVDGDVSNSSISETNNETEAWWEVDLQAVYPIEEIEVWNRTDCCTGRLSNYFILVSDQAFTSNDLSVCLLDPDVNSYFQSAVAGTPSTISIDTTARYVRIQLQGTDVLNLAEVVITPACISAVDGCDPDINLTYSEVNIPSGCSYDITRTWEATDNCGNVTSATQVITVSTTLDINASTTTDFNGEELSCNGASDGNAEVIINGGVPPLNVSWSDGQSGTTAINLSGTTYYVTVTDGNGCVAVDSVTFTPPSDITLNANITSNHNGEDISCYGGNDGSVFANASGGTGAISYAWSSGHNTPGASSLSAGTYTVTATDANGCTVTANVTLDNPDEVTVNANVTSDFNGEHISCPGLNDGEATAIASGGTGTITYNWSNSSSGTVNSNLVAGMYFVTATDINGCFAIDSVTLIDPTIITFTFSTETDPTICEGTDGVVGISASGGMGTYQYRLGATGTWQSGNSFTGLAAGTYDFYVRNSDGTCIVGPTSVTLDDPIPQSCPILPAIDTLIYCNTDVSVVLSVVPAPGASGYTWNVPVGMNIVSGVGTNSIDLDMNEIATGSYDICMVTNSNCGDSPACCITLEIIECVEICNNGIDDDGDGDIDLEDDECLTCDVVYNSNEEYLQRINLASGLAEDTLNASVLSNDGDAIGLDPISLRFYFLEAGSSNPSISYLDPNTNNQINTGVTIPATAIVPALGFNASGLAYAISEKWRTIFYYN